MVTTKPTAARPAPVIRAAETLSEHIHLDRIGRRHGLGLRFGIAAERAPRQAGLAPNDPTLPLARRSDHVDADDAPAQRATSSCRLQRVGLFPALANVQLQLDHREAPAWLIGEMAPIPFTDPRDYYWTVPPSQRMRRNEILERLKAQGLVEFPDEDTVVFGGGIVRATRPKED